MSSSSERARSLLAQVQTLLDVGEVDAERRDLLLAAFQGSLESYALESRAGMERILSDLTADSTAYLRGVADGQKAFAVEASKDVGRLAGLPAVTTSTIVQAAQMFVRCGLLEIDSDGVRGNVRLDGRDVPCRKAELTLEAGAPPRVILDVVTYLMRAPASACQGG